MNKLKSIFASVLGVDPEKINIDMSPENTPSWDSLNAIVLITEIEKGLDIIFTYQEAMAVKNFGDVITLITSKGANLND